MRNTICARCRLALAHNSRARSATHQVRTSPATASRTSSSSRRELSTSARRPTSGNGQAEQQLDPSAILSKPTWSVRSLLPPTETEAPQQQQPPTEQITPQTLRHLLRLSALPPPASPEEEAELLDTLSAQLHFVRSIQAVDTTGVEPLRAIRDETAAGFAEQTIGLETLREALDKEDVVGHGKRPRRRREKVDAREVEDWDVLGGAKMTVGRYFVVRSGKGEPPP